MEANLKIVPPATKSNKKATKVAKVAKAVSAKMARRLKLQHAAGCVIAAVGTGLTLVSLAHIADGMQALTNHAIPTWQAWCIAVGLDINYVAMELAGVVAATSVVRDRLHKYTRVGIPAVASFSMVLNAMEFSHATNVLDINAAGGVAGVAIVGLVLLAYRIAAVLTDA